MRRILLGVLGIGFCVVLSVILFAFMEKPEPTGPFVGYEFSEEDYLSFDGLVEKAKPVGDLVLPAWMPHGFRLIEIVRMGFGVVLFYSNKDLTIRNHTDGYAANITIQIVRPKVSPSPDERRKYPGPGELVEVGGFCVGVDENAAPDSWMERHDVRPIVADFYCESFYYYICGKKGEVTREDMLRIVAGMKLVCPETLRKE